MSDLELVLWVLGLTAVSLLLFGPGMWSHSWGWSFLDRLVGKKPKGPAKPPEGPGPKP